MEQKKGERHRYISTAQRLESTPLSGKVKAFVFYPMLISSKIHSEVYFKKKKKSGRGTGLFLKNIHYVCGYKIRKKCFM